MKFGPTWVALGVSLIAAASTASVRAEGDPARGKVLAYTCHGCHGVPNYKNAYPNYSVPKLGGQNAQYLENALKGYASSERPHPTMHAHAATMSEQDRADIAMYLQSEVVQPGKQVVGTSPNAAGTCVACHGADGATTTSTEYPILAGQEADYLVHALKEYKSGKRKNAVMAGMIAQVKEEDFEEIALFYAQQPGLCDTDAIREHGKCLRK